MSDTRVHISATLWSNITKECKRIGVVMDSQPEVTEEIFNSTNYECLNETGKYLNPLDAYTYYVCENGSSTLKECKDKPYFAWNDINKTCERIANNSSNKASMYQNVNHVQNYSHWIEAGNAVVQLTAQAGSVHKEANVSINIKFYNVQNEEIHNEAFGPFTTIQDVVRTALIEPNTTGIAVEIRFIRHSTGTDFQNFGFCNNIYFSIEHKRSY
ncbi:unnamed protein product [Didymodactylos carnosus]|uniref:Chitin-binding type-2 domain-containing protein n=1 Tax=Didymodactylos carnosus TaxID=1234261 RepID=A0A8S2K3X5_9BILA|nr:unnamed protein product [Didymodactylos carnosus]CAF3836227.1 unnamed protein product [Didymodactylos carnosus]